MARNPGGPPPTQNRRPAAVPAKAVAVGGFGKAPDVVKPPFNPIGWITGLPKFFEEVNAERRKITWTAWRETWITSMMVFMMVVLTAVFFLIVDQILGNGMQALLKLAA